MVVTLGIEMMGMMIQMMSKKSVIIFLLLFSIGIILFFNYWGILGLLFMKLVLGMKVKGATTFGKALLKVGGKKVIFMASGGMLLKRHIIDTFSKFFAEHSIGKYKKNIGRVFKLKYEEMKNSTGIVKIRAMGTMLLSIPFVYFMWTKVIASFAQKFIYAALYPIVLGIWTFLISSFGIVSNFLTFLFQVIILNMGLNFLERYKWGRSFLKGIDITISFFGDIFGYINDFFIFLGFDPKHFMIKKSIDFNKWLEKIIDKKLNKRDRLLARRLRHITAHEQLKIRREAFKVKEETPKTVWKRTKILYKKKILKEVDWREKRAKRREKNERPKSRIERKKI